MGTSGPYIPSPKWKKIKGSVTNALSQDSLDGESAHEVLGKFVNQLCKDKEEGFGKLPPDIGKLSPDDAKQKLDDLLSKLPELPSLAQWTSQFTPRKSGNSSGGVSSRSTGSKRPEQRQSAGGGKGKSSSKSSSKSVRSTALKLASFLSQVPKLGLRQALANIGLTSPDGLPPDKLALAVVDILAANATHLIQTELRDALAKVMEEICNEPVSFDQAEKNLTESAYNLQDVLQSLFECYIMERFKTFFCEHEAKKYGFDAADSILKEARDFVSTEMNLEKQSHRDLTQVDWNGSEGFKIIDGILARTIAIYTGE